jgi:HK97 gp10 family phage protein
MKIKLDFDLNENVDNEINQALEKGLTAAGIFCVAEAKKKTVVDTGTLRDNTFYEVDKNTVLIYNLMEYAPYIELGTVRMEARPFLRPAVFNNRKKITDIIAYYLKEAL